MRFLQAVEIEWIDSRSPYPIWMNPADLPEWNAQPLPIRTLGYFWEKTRHEIVIVQGYSVTGDEIEQALHVFAIPLGCVRKIRRMK